MTDNTECEWSSFRVWRSAGDCGTSRTEIHSDNCACGKGHMNMNMSNAIATSFEIEIGKALRQRFSTYALAEHLGVTPEVIDQWLLGKLLPCHEVQVAMIKSMYDSKGFLIDCGDKNCLHYLNNISHKHEPPRSLAERYMSSPSPSLVPDSYLNGQTPPSNRCINCGASGHSVKNCEQV